MARFVHYELINDIFSNNGCWEMDIEKLSDLTSQEFAEEVFEHFEESSVINRFNVQVVKESGVETFGDPFESIIVSLGHSFASRYYTYRTYSGEWDFIAISQDFFEDVVKPFQSNINLFTSLAHRAPELTTIYHNKSGRHSKCLLYPEKRGHF